MPFNDACSFEKTNKEDLQKLTDIATIVLCPSFVALQRLEEYASNTEILIGAQNCSQFQSGPYTGEVSAVSLQQIGVNFCIVGHSERRRNFGETNQIIAQKVERTIENLIIPIICIGETKQQHEKKETFNVLEAQLIDVLEVLSKHPESPFVIAYEPVWAIGSGAVPNINDLTKTFDWLQGHIKRNHPQAQVQFLYGGSVTEENSEKIIQIEHVDGFLIGGASLDFQKFQNIVLLNS